MSEILLSPFLLGAVGALAPEIVRLYNWRRRKNLPAFSTFYFVISFLYMFIGGVLAVALAREGQPVSSFYIGAALPFVLDAGIKGAVGGGPGGGPEGSSVEDIEIESLGLADQLRSFARTLTW